MRARQVFCAYPRRESPCEKFREYHPRQWVDCSSSAYEGSRPPPFVLFTSSPRAARGGRRGKTEIPGAPCVGCTLSIHPLPWVVFPDLSHELSRGSMRKNLTAHPQRSFGRRSHYAPLTLA